MYYKSIPHSEINNTNIQRLLNVESQILTIRRNRLYDDTFEKL